MKNNAILRIIIWSIVIVLLLGPLAGALGYSQFKRNRRSEVTPDSTRNTQDGRENTVQYDASEIRSLNIQWAAGNITIQPDADIDTIQISERSVENSKHQTVYKKTGGTLTIQFSQDSIVGFGISIRDNLKKDLTILVPEGWECDKLEVEAASANLFLSDLTIRDMEFDGASGIAEYHNCILDSLDIDTASGDIHFHGSLHTLDIDAASASFYGDLLTTPDRIDMDSMSGNLELTLPEQTGFIVHLDGLSTDFSSDFETITRNDSHIFGDGKCEINVDAMSGDVKILRK